MSVIIICMVLLMDVESGRCQDFLSLDVGTTMNKTFDDW